MSAVLFLTVYNLRSRQACLDKCRHTPGKRPEMDVGFGLGPDKCYSKPVKAKFVSRNSSLPTGHLIPNYFIYCVDWEGKHAATV